MFEIGGYYVRIVNRIALQDHIMKHMADDLEVFCIITENNSPSFWRENCSDVWQYREEEKMTTIFCIIKQVCNGRKENIFYWLLFWANVWRTSFNVLILKQTYGSFTQYAQKICNRNVKTTNVTVGWNGNAFREGGN